MPRYLDDLLGLRPALSEWLSVEPPGTGEGGSGGSGGDGSGSGDGTGGDGGQGSGSEGQDDGKKGDDGKGAEGQGDGKTFTQADLDRILADRMARAEKQWKSQVEEAAERAKMDEAERLKAEKADAEKATEEARREALVTKVETRAERAALTAKVDPERVGRFVQLLDLANLDSLTDDGKPDEDAIKAAVDKTLKDWPEFVADDGKGKPPGRSGAEMSGHNNNGGRRLNMNEAIAARLGAQQ